MTIMAFHTNKRKYVYNYTQVTLKPAIKISAFEYLKLHAISWNKSITVGRRSEFAT